MLIGAIVAHLSDFLGGISSKKKIIKIFLCTILLSFLLKICQRYVIFKIFQVHLQVLLSLQNNGYMDITLLLKVQMLMK
jgi:hypothetical protein